MFKLSSVLFFLFSIAFSLKAESKDSFSDLIDKDVEILYQLNENKPFWEESEKVENFFTLLRASYLNGLNPDDYNVNLKSDKKLNDIILTKTLIKYCKDLYYGNVNPREIFNTWNIVVKKDFPYNDIVKILKTSDIAKIEEVCEPKFQQYKELKKFLREYYLIKNELPKIRSKLYLNSKREEVKNLKKILFAYGDYKNQKNLESDLFDEEVLEAVKSFQERHLLDPDGVVGPKTRYELNRSVQERIEIIKVNLEKYRWLPETLAPERIEINIPSFYLKYYQNNKKILEMKVIVGKDYIEDFRPTPIYFGKVTEVILNPFWYVPKKIAVKDLLPKIKKNPNYLEEYNFKVLYEGKYIDYKKINWYLYNEYFFPFNLVQLPGDKNSLGKIKIFFKNPFGVYLHDTPYKDLFLKVKRAFSSGCIRLENALLLASYLLNEEEKNILDIINSGKTVQLKINKDVIIYIFYFTTEVKNDKIFFYEDIYRFDKKILEKLKKDDE